MNKTTKMANPQTVVREWHVVDASDIPLGRLASQIAQLLRGKHKPTFTPHTDCGDFVVVLNTDKIVLTGAKLTDKFHYRPSRYPGNMKQIQYKELLAERSDYMLWLAVKRMVPNTRLRDDQMNRMKAFKGAEHTHQAQQPKPRKLVGGRR
ncbi:MAG: 50S ribosomal protein L13 [Firmicutes bacterium]|nr:50S ribosomal protein L13 [Bacillota bacterium]MCL2770688.1 50S ribosomal protein L13 [Bacillota bacterium]